MAKNLHFVDIIFVYRWLALSKALQRQRSTSSPSLYLSTPMERLNFRWLVLFMFAAGCVQPCLSETPADKSCEDDSIFIDCALYGGALALLHILLYLIVQICYCHGKAKSPKKMGTISTRTRSIAPKSKPMSVKSGASSTKSKSKRPKSTKVGSKSSGSKRAKSSRTGSKSVGSKRPKSSGGGSKTAGSKRPMSRK